MSENFMPAATEAAPSDALPTVGSTPDGVLVGADQPAPVETAPDLSSRSLE